MPQLSVVQSSPVKPGTRLDVSGSGFDPKTFVSLVFDGVGATTKFEVRADGTFQLGKPVVSTKADGTYKLEARKHGTSTVLATYDVVVKKTIVPPPDITPPVVSNVLVDSITRTSAKVRWSLSEPGTGQVQYGYTEALGQATTFEPSLLLSHSQTISGLEADRTVYFMPVSTDAARNASLTPVQSFKTPPEVVIPPSNEKIVPVTNIADLRKYLADNSVDKIIAEDGRYIANGGTGAGSLWIGSQAAGGTPFAERTRPIIIQARNKHKAIIEGGYLSFEDGAHDQIWDGFRHSNMTVVSNGVITIGGYTPRKAPHHIICRNFWIDDTCKAYVGTTSNGVKHGPDGAQDHAIYPAHAIDDGPNNCVFEDFRIDCKNLNGALHSWHPEPGEAGYQPRDMIFRRGLITFPRWGIVVGHNNPVTGYVFEDLRIEDARRVVIGWSTPNPNPVIYRRVVSVRSKAIFERNFSSASFPPGMPGFVFEACNFDGTLVG